MSSESAETDEVGYRRPPKATRFQKGTSGNPSGRPKKPAHSLDPGLVLEGSKTRRSSCEKMANAN
jgi:Family of unknown function (DUF5681)